MFRCGVFLLFTLPVLAHVPSTILEELIKQKRHCYSVQKIRYEKEIDMYIDGRLSNSQVLIRASILSDRITNFRIIPHLSYCIKDKELQTCFNEGYKQKKNVKVTFDTLNYSMKSFVHTFERFFGDRLCLFDCNSEIKYSGLLYAMKSIAEDVCDCKYEASVLIKECSMKVFVNSVMDCVSDHYMAKLSELAYKEDGDMEISARYGLGPFDRLPSKSKKLKNNEHIISKLKKWKSLKSSKKHAKKNEL